MNIPQPTTHVAIKALFPPFYTMLSYVMSKAIEVEAVTREALEYFPETNELVYHLVVIPEDREFNSALADAQEIWVVTDAGSPN